MPWEFSEAVKCCKLSFNPRCRNLKKDRVYSKHGEKVGILHTFSPPCRPRTTLTLALFPEYHDLMKSWGLVGWVVSVVYRLGRIWLLFWSSSQQKRRSCDFWRCLFLLFRLRVRLSVDFWTIWAKSKWFCMDFPPDVTWKYLKSLVRRRTELVGFNTGRIREVLTNETLEMVVSGKGKLSWKISFSGFRLKL